MSTDLGDRYGHPRTSRLTIALVIVIGIAAAVWLVWAIHGTVNPEVTSGQVSFNVVNPHRADTKIEVRLRSTSVHATCLLQAQAEDHSVVGEANVKVPTDKGRTVTLSESIRTARQATGVVLVGCTTPTQKRPQ